MSDEKKSTELVVQGTQGLEVLGDKSELEARIKKYEETREVIVDYIDRNFTKGIDYGWTDPRSMEKSTLKKPGAEKICRLFNTSPEWMVDWDTWKMLGEPKNIVCYICYIKDNATGRIIGQGRGAATVGEKSRDVNKTIKNGEKVSVVDACLYTFMLSEKFTQDDGGKASLVVLKENLILDTGVLRAGIKSQMSDVKWLHEVMKQEIHKSIISTIAEHAHMRKSIFEEKLFDLSTGVKK